MELYYIKIKGGYHQKELLNRLLNNYDVFEIPIENDNGGKLRVEVGLSIQQIVDVVSKILLNSTAQALLVTLKTEY